jgi:nucleolar MIF4G domain-containing protein 1
LFEAEGRRQNFTFIVRKTLSVENMSRNHKVPKLPQELLDQVSVGTGTQKKRGKKQQFGRKEQRKQLRQEKKTRRNQRQRYHEDENDSDPEDVLEPGESPEPLPTKQRRPQPELPLSSVAKSTLKKRIPDEDTLDSAPSLSRGQRAALEQDDDEILSLEKKLGIAKSKKRSRAFQEDGLEDLLDGIDEMVGLGSSKQKAEDQEWLNRKRRRVQVEAEDDWDNEDESNPDFDMDEEVEQVEAGFEESSDLDNEDEDDSDADPIADSDSDEEDLDDDEQSPPQRVRENPYVPPVAPGAAAKYVPPHMRGAPTEDNVALGRLRRQLQGLLNRLTEANLLSIVRDAEAIYHTNARQHVTSTLIDLLVELICDRSALLDTFLILQAGFLAALYKVVGTQFGAQLLERLVTEFDRYYIEEKTQSLQAKQTSNLIALLADLYALQVTTSAIVFDFIRLLLSELSEFNTELLLKLIRTCGPLLRQDDPRALKDMVMLLQKAVSEKGKTNLSVRTQFMIDTINDLKNNRLKNNSTSAIATEHLVRMKKTLGTLRAKSTKASEPLGIGLQDIRNADKGGKWWLVGASWRNEDTQSTHTESTQKAIGSDDVFMEGAKTDLLRLAKDNRMNTDVRRAIFVGIMGAEDYKEANARLLKLRLTKSQELEIPSVLLHCVGAEPTYNRYYTLVAKKLCGDHKFRKAFQFRLWGVFRQLGEKDRLNEDDDDEDEVDDDENQMDLRKIVNLATMYAELIASGSLPITILKVC